MDLQKLRPTHSQWRGPLATAAEGRARAATNPPTASIAKTLAHPPKGRGNELWQKFRADAIARGHPEPERLADTLLRSREHAMEIEAKRHKVLMTDKVPKPAEVAVVNKGKAARPVVPEGQRCQAKTLAGKQCGFKATCGCFCKKHAVQTPEIRAVAADKLTGATYKGYVCAAPEQAIRVFGKPNGPANGVWFMEVDGVLMRAYYRNDDAALHVDGLEIGALAKLRVALGL